MLLQPCRPIVGGQLYIEISPCVSKEVSVNALERWLKYTVRKQKLVLRATFRTPTTQITWRHLQSIVSLDAPAVLSYSRGPIEHRDLTLLSKEVPVNSLENWENFQGNHKGNTSHAWQLPSHCSCKLFMQTGHKLVQHAHYSN